MINLHRLVRIAQALGDMGMTNESNAILDEVAELENTTANIPSVQESLDKLVGGLIADMFEHGSDFTTKESEVVLRNSIEEILRHPDIS